MGSGNGSSTARSSSHLCAKFALINARSIRKQALLVRDYIDEHELDVVALTETWLAEGETIVESELCGEDFTFVHQPRSGARRGGGVGVLFRKTLQLVSRADIDTHASETCCVILRNIRIGCTIRVIVVYRPPTSNFRSFLDDVGKVLLIAAAHPAETVVCGDFNTRYGDSTCAEAMNLADLLETHGFVQHVQSATHERGNILDLVITSGTYHVIATTVEPKTLLTDHRVIECGLRQPKPERMTRRVQYRKYSAIDGSRFTADLAASHLNVPEQNPEVILTRYDGCIRSIVNAHAPVISRTITARPKTPWHTSELTDEKRALRRAERNWRQTGLTVHRQIYTGLRNAFRKSLRTARSHYYRTEMTSAGGNIRRVYQIANTLLGRAGDRPLPEDATQATVAAKFQKSFSEKIDALRRNMTQSSTEDVVTNVAARLVCFEAASPADVKNIILASATKSCELDPLPTSLLQQNIKVLCPVITRIINASLSTALVPQSMKHAIVTPVLKKRGADVNVLSNFRPISNISFVAKTMERFVSRQLQRFLNENGILGVYQSAYRPRHSAETALLRIHSDVAQAIDARRGVLLVLLDLTAAFDTINHDILLRRLFGYGICGEAHAWLASYLYGRTSAVRVGKEVSGCTVMRSGVPQGSVLGPVLFNAYIAPLTNLLNRHDVQHHLYADDTQLYVDFPPFEHTNALIRMEACISEVKTWLYDNGLVLNESKTEAIVIRSSSLRRPILIDHVDICGQYVATSTIVRDLGVAIDADLSMATQVANVCRSAYYHLSRIARVREAMTTSVCKCLVHALVTSRIDYGNAMLFGIPDRLLHRLERVQRSTARVVMQLRRGDRRSITAVLQQLHWLPVRKRIEYKLLMVVHTALYAGTPVYIASLLHRYAPRRTLRSGGGLLLNVPRVTLERYGRRAFACAGPTLWNSLPLELRAIENTRQFGKLLKTFLFSN